jgi:DNA ligase-1
MTIHQSTEIFKLDSKGKIRTWQYVVEGDSWWTIAGLQDGNKVTSAPTKCVPASQPTAEEQALFEAEAELKKKLKRDYHTTVEGTSTAKYFAPMLAEKYDPKLVEEGDLAQPKLDGIRCIATRNGLRTRKGEVISSCPHISAQLSAFFHNFPNAILDGELYNHDFKDNFNELASIIRKKRPSDAQLKKAPGDWEAQLERAARDIEFHVYDLVYGDDLAVEATDRSADLHNRSVDFGWSIHVVPTTPVSSDAEVREFFQASIRRGYEGIMVRKARAPYHQKRTKALMKFKEFITEEFEISDIFEGLGNWAGYAKSVEFKMPGDHRKENGDRPDAGIKGDQAFCKALLARRDELIGKKVTIRYFELTPGGIPRFPVAIDFDRPDA